MESRFGWKQIRNEEFQESDMWEMMEEKVVLNESRKTERSSIGAVSRQLPTARAMLSPRPNKGPTPDPKMAQHSAPVNVPDWPKIYGKTPMPTSSTHGGGGGGGGDGDGDGDMEGGIFVPPHQWLAMKEGRMKISSMSVCEGAGRTLKGRDMRRVRHTVLTKTGFI